MKYSKQRNLILEILRNTDTHPHASWVFEKAKEKMPGIGIATVYRNLRALEESGDIRKIGCTTGEDRYDGDVSEHFHMECTICGRLIDLHTERTEQVDVLKELMCKTFGVRDNDVLLGSTLLTGVCNECLTLRQAAENDRINVSAAGQGYLTY